MIAGAVLGQAVAVMRGADPSGAFRSVRLFIFSALAFIVIRITGRHLSRDASYQPEIIKVRGHQPPSTDALALPGAEAFNPMDQTVFISSSNTATFHCPQCGKAKTADVSRYAATGKKVTVSCTCACGHQFRCRLEKRKQYRKGSDLPGKFTLLGEDGLRGTPAW
jgi:DNA-directed RNA polymerase subunit M/transcription elongation factor TFIIS